MQGDEVGIGGGDRRVADEDLGLGAAGAVDEGDAAAFGGGHGGEGPVERAAFGHGCEGGGEVFGEVVGGDVAAGADDEVVAGVDAGGVSGDVGGGDGGEGGAVAGGALAEGVVGVHHALEPDAGEGAVFVAGGVELGEHLALDLFDFGGLEARGAEHFADEVEVAVEVAGEHRAADADGVVAGGGDQLGAEDFDGFFEFDAAAVVGAADERAVGERGEALPVGGVEGGAGSEVEREVHAGEGGVGHQDGLHGSPRERSAGSGHAGQAGSGHYNSAHSSGRPTTTVRLSGRSTSRATCTTSSAVTARRRSAAMKRSKQSSAVIAQ